MVRTLSEETQLLMARLMTKEEMDIEKELLLYIIPLLETTL